MADETKTADGKATAAKKTEVDLLTPITFIALKTCYTPGGALVEAGQTFQEARKGYLKADGVYEVPPYLEEVSEKVEEKA